MKHRLILVCAILLSVAACSSSSSNSPATSSSSSSSAAQPSSSAHRGGRHPRSAVKTSRGQCSSEVPARERKVRSVLCTKRRFNRSRPVRRSLSCFWCNPSSNRSGSMNLWLLRKTLQTGKIVASGASQGTDPSTVQPGQRALALHSLSAPARSSQLTTRCRSRSK